MALPNPDRAVVPASRLDSRTTGLPPDLIAQSAVRLRIQALLYAMGFFLSGVFPALISAEGRAWLFATPGNWAPSTLSIVTALAVAAVTYSSRIAPARVMTLGLIFQVVGSIGIAFAEFGEGRIYDVQPPWAGLSWVAIWVLGFTVIVPNPPRRALTAAILSLSSVPILVGIEMSLPSTTMRLPPLPFFLTMVLPYTIVMIIAYVGARVVHNLGTALTRARELGSYVLVDLLGQGGMGEVWTAKHRLLARPAAVKLVRPDVVKDAPDRRRAEFLGRFEREAQVTATLRSPHTVDLYDFGVADDGTLYYVMELLDGFDLGSLVTRFGPVPAERVVDMLMQVCHSLAEAHEHGLVHRDIKPANIYVCRHGRDVDVVKVLDFGLVKSLGHDHTTELDLSRANAVAGTPAFMAPEQALAKPLDGRADIYATGCVAYWLLTGQRVFAGSTPIEVMLQHAQTPPVPPSQRTDAPIPPDLEAIVLSCLAKDPDDRPRSADLLRARLEAIVPAAPWTADRKRAWWNQHAPKARSSDRGVTTPGVFDR